MNELARHIQKLLLESDFAIIPGISFSSVYAASDGIFSDHCLLRGFIWNAG